MTTVTELGRVLSVQLPEKPALPAWAFAADLGDGRIQLRSPRSILSIKAPELTDVYWRLQGHLDGRLTVDELRELGGERAHYVKVLLKILRAHGFLQESVAPDELEPEQIARYDGQLRVLGQLGADPLAILAQLRRARVLVMGDGGLTDLVTDSLSDCGIDPRVVTSVDCCDLLIGCFGSRDQQTTKQVNVECIEAGVRLLPVFVDGPTGSLGPTVIPRETACLQCLENRRASTRQDPDDWVRYRSQLESGGVTDTGALPPLLRIIASHAALETVRLLTSVAPPATVGSILEFSIDSPRTTTQTVLKSPRCEVCGRKAPVPEAWDVKLGPLEVHQ